MDIVITSLTGDRYKFSDYGLRVMSFEESPATISRTTKTVDGRNGSLDYGGRHDSKKIKAEIFYSASSMSDDEHMQETMNGILSSLDKYYVQFINNDKDMYSFERPGETYGETNWNKGTVSHKRFLVSRSDNNSPEFQGKIGGSLHSTWSFEWETTDLPYGESVPRNVVLTNGNPIVYNGNVNCSQLEQFFYFQIKPTASAQSLTLTVDDQKIVVNYAVRSGDTIKLTGMDYVVNSTNVNDKTNYGYVILKTNKPNKFSIDIPAQVTIMNLKDLYV